MFEKLRKYESAVKFLAHKGGLILVTKKDQERRLSYNLSGLDNLFEIESLNIYDFLPLPSNRLLFSTMAPEETFILHSQGVMNKQDYVMHLGGIESGAKFYCLADFKGVRGYLEFDKHEEKMGRFWSLPFFTPKGRRSISTDTLLTSYGKEAYLVCHQLSNGMELWRVEYNLLLGGQNARLSGEVVCYADKIFINLDDDNLPKSKCFVLSSDSGEVIHTCDLFGGHLKTQNGGKLYGINYKLGARRKEGGGINDYLRNVLFVLDMNTLEEYHIDMSEALDALDIKDETGKIERHFRIKNDHLTVSNNRLYCHGDQDSRIAVVDLDRNELLWNTTIDVENYPYQFIKDIQADNGHLFVLDAGGGLHIFKEGFSSI